MAGDQKMYGNPTYQPTETIGGRGQSYSLGPTDGHFKKGAGRRRCCIVFGIICLVLILAAGLALGLYFGVFKEKSDSTAQSATEAPEPVTEASFEIILKLDQPYNADLDDPSSPVYSNLKTDIENLMNGIMESSDLSEAFIKVAVTRFRPGSICVVVKADFKSKKQKKKNETFTIDDVLVSDRVKTGLSSKLVDVNRLKIDIHRIRVDRFLEFGLDEEGCWKTSQCLTPGATCRYSICSCPVSQFYNGSQCINKYSIDEFGCLGHDQCGTPGSMCDEDSICSCNSAYLYFDGNHCIKRKGVQEMCSGDHECQSSYECQNNTCTCPNNSHAEGSLCVEDPRSCNDLHIADAAATQCLLNLSTLDHELKNYTCRTFVKKIMCLLEYINTARFYTFYCKGKELRNLLLGHYTSLNLPTSFYNCSEWGVTLTFYKDICDDDGFIDDVKINKFPVLFDAFDYELKLTSKIHFGPPCVYTYEFQLSLWSNLLQENIEENLTKILSAHSLFATDDAHVAVEPLYIDINYCKYKPALIQFGVKCFREIDEWFHFTGWGTCGPIHELARCIRRQIANKLFQNMQSCTNSLVVETMFNNANAKDQFLTEVTEKMNLEGTPPDIQTNGTRYLLIKMITRYSVEVCPDGEDEINPCQPMEKAKVIDMCINKSMKSSINLSSSQMNYGITPDNCREFFYSLSCVVDEMSKLGAQCENRFLDWSVFNSLMAQYDTNNIVPSHISAVEFCNAYRPVCTSDFIKNVALGHEVALGQCAVSLSSDPITCMSEKDVKQATDFVTCVGLIALSKNQDDCTPLKIKEIIKNDYFKLNIMNRFADVDQCLPDDSIADLLPSQDSVCTGGAPMIFLQSTCAQHTYMDNTNKSGSRLGDDEVDNNPFLPVPCTTTANQIIDTGYVSAGCRLYLEQMACIKTHLANFSFSCSMQQLVESPVAVMSPFYLRGHAVTCLEMYATDEYKHCGSLLATNEEVGMCTELISSNPYSLSDNTIHILCGIFQEILRCHDDLAKKEMLTCSMDQIQNYLLDKATIAYYSWRPKTQCDDFAVEIPFTNCPALLLDGSMCKNSERLTNFLMGTCGHVSQLLLMDKFDTSQSVDVTALNCLLMPYILQCGSSVPPPGLRCFRHQIISAMTERQDIAGSFFPGLEAGVCQDGCYDTDDAVHTCLQPYLHDNIIRSLPLCKVYVYMWHCLNSRVRHTNGSYCDPRIIDSTLTGSIALAFNNYSALYGCPGLKDSYLDICNYVQDIVALGRFQCETLLSNTDRETCQGIEPARRCYQDIIDTFGEGCQDDESLAGRAIILRAAELNMNVIHCIVDNFTKEGYCPYSSCCANTSLTLERCVIDADCYFSEKCCLSGCETTCRGALPQPGRCLNFDQGSLIKFQVSRTDTLKNINLRYIKVGFITKRKHGILLQINDGGAHTSDFRYISLEINNIGGVKLFIDFNWERWEMNSAVSPNNDFTDGKAHEVVIIRRPIEVEMQVDNETMMTFTFHSDPFETITPDDINSVFIGNNQTASSYRAFSGCIYSLQIDDINIFEDILKEPRSADIHLVPNESKIFSDMACGDNG